MFRCLGILREVQHSPNRESDDALILQAVLSQLKNLGIQANIITPEESDELRDFDYDVILPMCESYPRLMRLMPLAQASSAFWVNAPLGVLNCYRTRMVAALANHADLAFPLTEIRSVRDGAGEPPKNMRAPDGWWIKRGDVHNTCDRDVLRARAWSQAADIVSDFRAREITHWIVQPHIDGDLVKFYGVGPNRWFTWFYHDPLRARRLPFVLDALATQAGRGARALGLQVFGGDAIISPDGSITVIDLNSWPSFALVRQEAAVQIAWHLQTLLQSADKLKIAQDTRNP